MSTLALVRRPSPRLADGLVTHIERTPVDVALDGSTNLYVLTQGDGRIRQYDQFGQLVATNNATLLTTPTAQIGRAHV